MSTARLTFLYPHLFRSIRAAEPIARTRASRTRPKCPSYGPTARNFASSDRQRENLVQRHGKAVEPFLAEGESPDSVKLFTPVVEGRDNEVKKADSSEPKGEKDASSAMPLSEETQAAARIPGDSDAENMQRNTVEEAQSPTEQATTNTTDPLAPLETILHMPAPETLAEDEATKPPHLQAPPYVHHFDTYTLVQKVAEGGFTSNQSITAMKAVRGLLAENLEVAKEGLVSKSDVENEIYLFRAACSELRTEVQNQRKANDEKMRRERTLLQHEVDILSQKLTQDLLTLKDDLKGMFDDRKMAVRSEQRAVESAIQQLNYKITVDLNSDSKSEVEGVRWLLTRRSVMGILFMAFMVLSSLRYASVLSHDEEEKKKRASMPKVPPPSHGERGEEVPLSATEILAAN